MIGVLKFLFSPQHFHFIGFLRPLLVDCGHYFPPKSRANNELAKMIKWKKEMLQIGLKRFSRHQHFLSIFFLPPKLVFVASIPPCRFPSSSFGLYFLIMIMIVRLSFSTHQSSQQQVGNLYPTQCPNWLITKGPMSLSWTFFLSWGLVLFTCYVY